MQTLPGLIGWKGYNCFSSVVGSLLTAHAYPAVSLALDSGFDFYYRPGPRWALGSFGVWPGSEHAMVARNLRTLFGIDLSLQSEPDWSVLEERLPGPDGFLVVAVVNTALPHTPRGEFIESVPHYLILSGRVGDMVTFHDSFFGRSGTISVRALERATDFVSDDGEVVRRRVCEFAGLTSPGRLSAPYIASPEKVARDTLPADAPLDTSGAGREEVFGPEAIRRLAEDLGTTDSGLVAGNLRAVAQSLRYVQYQRACFVRYLDEFGAFLPRLREPAALLAGQVRATIQSWFSVRFQAQYLSRKSRPFVAPSLGGLLRELANREETILSQLGRLKGVLGSSS
jgi:hypothetical protein